MSASKEALMAKSTLPHFSLSEVSESRKRFLLRWRLERKLDLDLRMASQAEEQALVAEGGLVRFGRASIPFDRAVCAGDIRLLPTSQASDEIRFLYVAVLYVRAESYSSVVVPFSPYSVPACKDEWLTGLESEPLKVLQFWNAQPVATSDLARSWKTGDLHEARLEQARLLYRHAIDGTWPQGELRDQVGISILNPSDERIAYQNEELAHFGTLRGRLFLLMEQADRYAKCPVRFETSDAFELGGMHRFERGERLAADSGDVTAEAVVLTSDGESVRLRAKREYVDCERFTLSWKFCKTASVVLVPGLPACLYAAGAKRPLVAQGGTTGDGTTIQFSVGSKAAFKRLCSQEAVWIVIRGQ